MALGNLAVPTVDWLPGAQDCPVTGAKLPLVIISHGNSGYFALHLDIVEALVNAGFVVAAINHAGNNTNDMSGRGMSVWASRPAQMVRLLDFMLNEWKDRAVIDPTRVGLFGFSLGALPGWCWSAVSPISTGLLASRTASRRSARSGAPASFHPIRRTIHGSRPP